jgi:hypothetical protein
MDLPSTPILLPVCRPLAIRNRGGLIVTCRAGRIWITLEGELRDLFLRPGETLLIEERGFVILEALEPAIVTVQDRTKAAPLLAGVQTIGKRFAGVADSSRPLG